MRSPIVYLQFRVESILPGEAEISHELSEFWVIDLKEFGWLERSSS